MQFLVFEPLEAEVGIAATNLRNQRGAGFLPGGPRAYRCLSHRRIKSAGVAGDAVLFHHGLADAGIALGERVGMRAQC